MILDIIGQEIVSWKWDQICLEEIPVSSPQNHLPFLEDLEPLPCLKIPSSSSGCASLDTNVRSSTFTNITPFQLAMPPCDKKRARESNGQMSVSSPLSVTKEYIIKNTI